MAPRVNKAIYKKPTFQTEKRVTRSQTTKDPHQDLQPATSQPRSILRRNKPRNVNQPWINLVVKELIAREPNLKKVAAIKKAGKMIRNATEQEKERWRKMAEKPRRNLSISDNVQVKLISPRAGKK